MFITRLITLKKKKTRSWATRLIKNHLDVWESCNLAHGVPNPHTYIYISLFIIYIYGHFLSIARVIVAIWQPQITDLEGSSSSFFCPEGQHFNRIRKCRHRAHYLYMYIKVYTYVQYTQLYHCNM